MAQMPVVEEGAEPPPYFPRTLVTQSVGTIKVLMKECDDDRSHALRGNAAQDALRPDVRKRSTLANQSVSSSCSPNASPTAAPLAVLSNRHQVVAPSCPDRRNCSAIVANRSAPYGLW